MSKPTKAEIHKKATKRAEDAKEQIAKWTEKVLETPSYAFEWAQESFRQAGLHEAWMAVARFSDSESKASVEDIEKWVGETIIRMARSASNHSTSVTSNLMEDCRLEAWATVAEYLTGHW